MTEARRQALRVRRFGLAAFTYLIWAAFMFYADVLGLYRLELWGVTVPVSWFITTMFIVNVFWFALFVTGANLRFEDPSLTLPMMLTALVLAVLTAGALPENRAISFPAFIVVFLFGIFNLRPRHYLVCWLIAMSGYIAITFATLPDGVDRRQLDTELLQGGLLAALMFWIAYFGYYVGQLRDKLSVRNNELKHALALVEELAVRDDLTGLHNRRFVMDSLERELQRAQRHRVPFAVLVLDIDRFKEINDSYGHAVGDEVLKHFVGRLVSAVRGVDLVGSGGEPGESDTIGRFGGEEFIVVLPHTSLAGARRVAERIVLETARTPFETSAGEVAVTVSVGVTEYHYGEPQRTLLERVDAAMYAAKHAGRDRVAVAPPEPDATPHVYTPSPTT